MHRPAALRVLTVCLILAAAALPARGLDLGGHDRDGTVFGLNVGAGWTNFSVNSPGFSETTDYESAFSGGARIGWATNDNLIYSLGIYGWKKDFSKDITPISSTTFNFLAEISWFPRGEGFWLRGGIGGGQFDFTVVLPAERQMIKKGGWNYALGAGYEIRMSDEIALGLAYDARYLRINAFDDYDASSSLTHMVSLNLHFYL